MDPLRLSVRAWGLVLVGLAACTFDATGIKIVEGGLGVPDAPVTDQDGRVALVDGRDARRADGAPRDKAVACGDLGQVCCNATTCGGALTCVGGSCVRLLQLDGVGNGNSESGTIQVTLTTTTANDLLYVAAVLSTDQSVQSVSSSPTLTWALRANLNYHGKEALVAYSAVWPSSGKITITMPLSGGTTHWAAIAFGVSGVNTAAPFDGTARTASGNSAAASISVTTTIANDFVVGVVGVGAKTPTLTPGAGYWAIVSAENPTARVTAAEYLRVGGPQTNLAVPFTLSDSTEWGMVAEAIRP